MPNTGGRMNNNPKGQPPQPTMRGTLGEAKCEIEAIVSPQVQTAGFDAAVSPAISPAVSPANGREQLIPETKGSQSGNESGSNSAKKPRCYTCKHRRTLIGDAHSECAHPQINGSDRILSPLLLAGGSTPPACKLNVHGSEHGIRNGWFMWPINFDPVWLVSCDGYQPKEAA